MKYNMNHFASIVLLLLSMGISHGQFTLKGSSSSITIEGTSTFHDWSAKTNSISGSLSADIKKGEVTEIHSARVKVPANSLKSGKSVMDKNMRKALKADEHPTIRFKLSRYELVDDEMQVHGKLTVAGVTREIKTTAEYSIESGNIKISGECSIDMTDYDIDPPTFLGGGMTTGKKVDINFRLMFYDDKKEG